MRSVLRTAVLALLALAMAGLTVLPAQAAAGDSVQGDGTGPNAILGTNNCSSALATRNGQFRPFVKVERSSSATTGTCNFRARVTYIPSGSSTEQSTPYYTRRDYVEAAASAGTPCHAYVGVQRNDGSWLTFTFYNQSGPAQCRR